MPESLKPSIPDLSLTNIIVEAYTEGERPAHARGYLNEVREGLFEITPFSLREFCGPEIKWRSPARGKPIENLFTFDQARDVLAWWAMQAVANDIACHR